MWEAVITTVASNARNRERNATLPPSGWRRGHPGSGLIKKRGSRSTPDLAVEEVEHVHTMNVKSNVCVDVFGP
jgi:hypothetical protein